MEKIYWDYIKYIELTENKVYNNWNYKALLDKIN